MTYNLPARIHFFYSIKSKDFSVTNWSITVCWKNQELKIHWFLNHKLWVTVMCQCWLIDCDKYITVCIISIVGEVVGMWEQGVYGNSILSFSLVVNLKCLWKTETIFFFLSSPYSKKKKNRKNFQWEMGRHFLTDMEFYLEGWKYFGNK